jgi:diguanylate cyclase (GGDEF)-like protein
MKIDMGTGPTAAVLRHRSLAPVAVLGFIVLAAALVAMFAFANVAQHMSQMRQATDAGFATDDAFTALVDQETGVRGYVATGNPLFLAPYRSGRTRYDRYAALPVTLRDPTALPQLRAFLAAAAETERFFDAEIAAVHAGRRAGAADALRAGKIRFDHLRAIEGDLERTLRGEIARNRVVMHTAFLFDEVVIGAMMLVIIAGGVSATVIAGRGRIDALLARRDPVTTLGNRHAFEERLAQMIAGTGQVGVVYLDLDGFKPINDRLGHAAGDELLLACAARIVGVIRPDDFAARIGGDEFAVIVAGTTPEALKTVCERISSAIDAPFTIAGTSVRLSASVGHALYPDDGKAVETIVRVADEAMYRAKRTRRAAAR